MTLQEIGRRGASSLAPNSPPGPGGIGPACRLLEDRTLLSGVTLQQALDAYDDVNAGVAVLNQIGATALVNQALNGVSIPFVNQTLASLPQLGLPGVVAPSLTSIENLLADAYGIAVTDATATGDQVQNALPAGFKILYPSPTAVWPITPDSNGNVLEVSYTAATNPLPPVSLNVAQNSPFQYLNNGFFANFSATAQFTVPYTVTFGVDLPSGQTQPLFFLLANPNAFGVSLSSSIAAKTINADLNIGDLANVTATNNTAQQALNITGNLGFQSLASNPLDAGGKLRASDFTNSLGQVVQGTVNGSAQLSLNLSTQLALLGNVDWIGNFSEALQNGNLQTPIVNIQLNEDPDAVAAQPGKAHSQCPGPGKRTGYFGPTAKCSGSTSAPDRPIHR